MSGERLALWWVDRYTRGVADAARGERRAEIASDVWEHRAAAGRRISAELGIVSRCVRGMPADIVWRRERLGRARVASARLVARGMGWAAAFAAFALLVVLHAQHAGPAVGLPSLAGGSSGDVVQAARPSALLLVLLVLGAALLFTSHPRLGAALVAAGAWGTAAWLSCIVLLFGPLALVITIAAVVLARRRVGRRKHVVSG